MWKDHKISEFLSKEIYVFKNACFGFLPSPPFPISPSLPLPKCRWFGGPPQKNLKF